VATGAAPPAGQPRFEYQNTGLNVNARPALLVNGQIEVRLSVELSLVDNSTGNFTPTFVQRSLQDIAQVRPNEPAMVLGVVQHELMWPAQTTARPGEQSRGSFVVMLTARLAD
jgi:hypothetical protein